MMMQDQQGFIWIGTIDGLIRYDGIEYKIYRNDPADPRSIPAGWVSAIMQDHRGIIWMGMQISDNLVAFDPTNGKFRTFHHNIKDNSSLAPGAIISICETRDGIIWVLTSNGALNVLDEKSGHFIHFPFHIKNSTIAEPTYPALINDRNEKLWLTINGSGILRFDPATKQFDSFNVDAPKENLPDQKNVNCVLQDHSGKIWIGTSSGLSYFDSATRNFHSYPLLSLASNIPVLCMHEDASNNLWLGTNGSGVLTLNLNTHALAICRHNDEDESSVSSNIVSFIGEDKSNQVWLISKESFGFDIYGGGNTKFNVFQHQPKNAFSLINNRIQFIYMDHQNNFYIGTYNGINVFDPLLGTFTSYKQIPSLHKGFTLGSIGQMFEDSRHNYWFSKIDEGVLYKYDPIENKVYSFNYADGLLNNNIWWIYEDTMGIIWISGLQGLEAYDPATRRMITYLKEHSSGMGMIYGDDKGMLWLAGDGLKLFDPVKKELIKEYRHLPDDTNSISSSTVLDICPGANGILWIGTMNGGLNAFDPKTEKFRAFMVKDGLPSNVVWTIMNDKKGNLWLSTNNGLCRFAPPQNPFDKNQKAVFNNYDITDGLPDNQFSMNARCKALDGSMYMGTASHGFIHFYPDRIKDNLFIPPVYITSFSVFNKQVVPGDQSGILKQTIENVKEITLRYDQNVFSFTFAALNYVHPEKNMYAYKLENFDKNWNTTDASKHVASYTNLDPGEYIFHVKATNNDGVWNEQGAFVKLIITPPYWQTLWFRISIMLLVAALLYGIYRYRVNQILKMQMLRNKIAGDLHDDLGSTLSSISIYSELIKKQAGIEIPMLTKISDSTRKMIDSMSDIVWSINSDNDIFESVIQRMRSFAHEMLSAKKIEYTFIADESLNQMKLSMETRKNLFLIFKEAVNNLVKHSGADHASIHLQHQDEKIKLFIRDNGKGFDELKVSEGDQTAAKGNGLKNMRRRAKELGGEITINSDEGKGTEIELCFKK
jgi:ligand-binding sensor domain-containing protein/two-component sensor histidine kinase